MDIKLWYSKDIKKWRWTLIHPSGEYESGQHYGLRPSMNDLAEAVERMVESHEYEGQDK
tara:strand:+ start:364 stop:540 length:177 start_codon:yes stop_codon:yes gene_type:complete